MSETALDLQAVRKQLDAGKEQFPAVVVGDLLADLAAANERVDDLGLVAQVKTERCEKLIVNLATADEKQKRLRQRVRDCERRRHVDLESWRKDIAERAALQARGAALEAVYIATNEMLAVLGGDGEINTDHTKVNDLMNVLHAVDHGIYEPSDVERLKARVAELDHYTALAESLSLQVDTLKAKVTALESEYCSRHKTRHWKDGFCVCCVLEDADAERDTLKAALREAPEPDDKLLTMANMQNWLNIWFKWYNRTRELL